MASPSPPPSEISPVAAAQDAIDNVRHFLFPFRAERWLGLGFVAFLDQCGRGAASAPPGDVVGMAPDQLPGVGGVGGWLGENALLAVLASALVLGLIVAITALVLWLSSRGIFMYIDNVATGRSDVARPWREHAERASSLFAWRFGLAATGLLLVFLIIALVVASAVAVQRDRLDPGVAMSVGLLLLLPIGLATLAFFLAAVALRDFAAPLQYRHDVPCGRAVEMVLDMVKAKPGSFLVYALLKFVFTITAGVALTLAGCLTCCIGLLPVVHQTLFQPVFYFERSWSLFLLRQMGHDVFGSSSTPAPREVSLADLRPLSPPPPPGSPAS